MRDYRNFAPFTSRCIKDAITLFEQGENRKSLRHTRCSVHKFPWRDDQFEMQPARRWSFPIAVFLYLCSSKGTVECVRENVNQKDGQQMKLPWSHYVDVEQVEIVIQQNGAINWLELLAMIILERQQIMVLVLEPGQNHLQLASIPESAPQLNSSCFVPNFSSYMANPLEFNMSSPTCFDGSICGSITTPGDRAIFAEYCKSGTPLFCLSRKGEGHSLQEITINGFGQWCKHMSHTMLFAPVQRIGATLETVGKMATFLEKNVLYMLLEPNTLLQQKEKEFIPLDKWPFEDIRMPPKNLSLAFQMRVRNHTCMAFPLSIQCAETSRPLVSDGLLNLPVAITLPVRDTVLPLYFENALQTKQ
ncbi:unnamed protein product [Soboliphyme baturini]|uniref:Uncharacterized protein n=1 Tax=Soboliphyme baturini TaxID=241478 RepID=A0A183IME5_9BILA|nr:unnamed protein product [Soboliphyme baturini]